MRLSSVNATERHRSSGSFMDWGSRGPGFKSRQPDQPRKRRPGAYGGLPRYIELGNMISMKLRGIEQIALQVDEGLAARIRSKNVGQFDWHHRTLLAATTELLGFLIDRERIAEIIGPIGPVLAASRMHPRGVASGSGPMERRSTPRRRDAIHAAATAIFNEHLPEKLGVRNWPPHELAGALKTDFPLVDQVGGNGPATRSRSASAPGLRNQNSGLDERPPRRSVPWACMRTARAQLTDTRPQRARRGSVDLEELPLLSRFARLAADR
jgi:hypothetical protein